MQLMADKRFFWSVVTTALLLAFSWGLYFYVTSVVGFDLALFEMFMATSALLVAFTAAVWGLARFMKSRRANGLART